MKLARIVECGPIPAVHGVVRWRLIDLAARVGDTFAIPGIHKHIEEAS